MLPVELEEGMSSYSHCSGFSQTSLGIRPAMWKAADKKLHWEIWISWTHDSPVCPSTKD